MNRDLALDTERRFTKRKSGLHPKVAASSCLSSALTAEAKSAGRALKLIPDTEA